MRRSARSAVSVRTFAAFAATAIATLAGCPDNKATTADASSSEASALVSDAAIVDAAAKAESHAALLPPYPEQPPCEPNEDTLPWVRSVAAVGPAGLDALAAGKDGSLWVAARDRIVKFDRSGETTSTVKALPHESFAALALDQSDRLYALTSVTGGAADAGSGAGAIDVVRVGPNGQAAVRREIKGESLGPAASLAVRPNGESYISLTFRGKLTIDKVTLESAKTSLAVIGLDADAHAVWAHAYATGDDAGNASLAIDASGSLLAAIPIRGDVTFGTETVKARAPDIALVTFDVNGGTERAIAAKIADGQPVRLLVDRQMSTILLARSDKGDVVLKNDALLQEVYRQVLSPAGSVETAVVIGAGELALLQKNGTDDAGAPRLALVRLDRAGASRDSVNRDHTISVNAGKGSDGGNVGASSSVAMITDRCGALSLATSSGASFSVATHAAN